MLTREEIPVFDLGETPNTRGYMLALDALDPETEEDDFVELAHLILNQTLFN